MPVIPVPPHWSWVARRSQRDRARVEQAWLAARVATGAGLLALGAAGLMGASRANLAPLALGLLGHGALAWHMRKRHNGVAAALLLFAPAVLTSALWWSAAASPPVLRALTLVSGALSVIYWRSLWATAGLAGADAARRAVPSGDLTLR